MAITQKTIDQLSRNYLRLFEAVITAYGVEFVMLEGSDKCQVKVHGVTLSPLFKDEVSALIHVIKVMTEPEF